MLPAEEILCNTQQVIAGLEALRGENCSLLESLQALEGSSVEGEKCSIIRQSLERIELGLSEAQVQIQLCLFKTKTELKLQLLCCSSGPVQFPPLLAYFLRFSVVICNCST